MGMKSSMGIRLDPEDRKKLENFANSWHISAADIVRMAIKSLLNEAETNNGKITIPFEFKTQKSDEIESISESPKRSNKKLQTAK